MNEQELKEAEEELQRLEAIDWDESAADVDAEYIEYRMRCLSADIFAARHFMEMGTNPIEETLSR